MILTTIMSLMLVFLFQSKALETEKPRLVVGVVVDQMRYEYLDRYWELYGEKGFKRLACEGYSFKNTHLSHFPSLTAPGHASIFTGTGPCGHGIIDNKWYDRQKKRVVESVEDDSEFPIGTNNRGGQKSPIRLKSSTFADENRLSTQLRGKSIGISLKDRGAILPAGRMANAAYWYVGGKEGKFVSSSYYMKQLPPWTVRFNNKGMAKAKLKKWGPFHDPQHYAESGRDNNNYEYGFIGKDNPVFPYDLKDLHEENGGLDILKNVPFGNDLLIEFVKAAIIGENLGRDEETDVLSISFSSTDGVGHNFGVNSKEMQDSFVRLDTNIADLLNFLDREVGKDEYLLFLTSDHGGINVPAYLQFVKFPSEHVDLEDFAQKIENWVDEKYDEDLVLTVSKNGIYLDHQKILKEGIDPVVLQNSLALFIFQEPAISRVFTRSQLMGLSCNNGLSYNLSLSYDPDRSGDLLFLMEPGIVIGSGKTGSSHGSAYNYDTHVPLLFFGKNIENGSSHKRVSIIDIAPTISAYLGIPYPNASMGCPLEEILD